jgi:hypothetical protein
MTYQVHLTWEAPAPHGTYTSNTHTGPTPTLTYAETLGPYPDEEAARHARGIALAKHPNAEATIHRLDTHTRT